MATGLQLNTVSNVLQELKKNVSEFVDAEIAKINGLTCPNVEAANVVSMAIDNARVAWDGNELIKEIEKVDEVVGKQISELKSLVSDLKSTQLAIQVNLRSRAMRFIHSLPLGSWYPKLLGFSDQYVYKKDSYFDISFFGMFKYNGKQVLYSVSQNSTLYNAWEGNKPTNTRLDFKRLYDDVRLDQKKRSFIHLQLNVEYKVTYLQWPKSAIYDIWVGIFPNSPGKINLITNVQKFVKTLKQNFRSPTMCLFRQDFASGTQKVMPIEPTKGWRLAAEPKIVVAGDHSYELDAANNRVNVTLCLNEKDVQVQTHVEFQEEKDEYDETKVETQVDLLWGKTHEFLATQFKVVFDSFDGGHIEMDAPDQTKPFLKITKLGDDKYQLTAEAPAQT